MDIKRVIAQYFTGAGTTREAVGLFCESLGLPFDLVDVTPRASRVAEFEQGDLAVFAAPSYGGRVPAPALAKFTQCEGKGIPAVLLVTYGNRAVDDTFIELYDLVARNGFSVVALGAVVAHHSLMTNVAVGRPDEDDRERIADMAAELKKKLAAVEGVAEAALAEVPGSRPYQDYGGVPFLPEVNSFACTRCGACADACPTGAIDSSDPIHVDADRCVSCMRCIAGCPYGAREIAGGLALAAARKAFALKCAKRRETYFIL